MALSRVDRIEVELDGIICFWETTSDIGTQVNNGESGIDPATGATIQTAGTYQPAPLNLTKVYDPVKDAEFVVMLLDVTPNAILRSGNTKATVIYYGDNGVIDQKFILSKLLVSSYKIPGKNGLSKSYGKLQVDFEVGNITAA